MSYLDQSDIYDDSPDNWTSDDLQIWADKEYAERLIVSYPQDSETEKARKWLENKKQI